MKHALEYIETMHKLESFVKSAPQYSTWDFGGICDWFCFYWNHGTLSWSIDSSGAAHGVCAIKLFERLEQFLMPFVHVPSGRFVMIEVMSADSPRAMGFIHDEFVDRWGPRDIVLWDRGARTESGTPRMFKWREFEKLARRITHGPVCT